MFVICIMLVSPWLSLCYLTIFHLSDVCKIHVPDPILCTAKLNKECLSFNCIVICEMCVSVCMLVSCRRMKLDLYMCDRERMFWSLVHMPQMFKDNTTKSSISKGKENNYMCLEFKRPVAYKLT